MPPKKKTPPEEETKTYDDAASKGGRLFKFYIHKKDEEGKEYKIEKFRCELKSAKCSLGIKNAKRKCGKTIDYGFPYCAEHLKTKKNLEIKKSKISPGMGLFAIASGPIKRKGTIIFTTAEKIVSYTGEPLKEADLKARYDEGKKVYTAPYAHSFSEKKIGINLDAACKRCAGSFINHATGDDANVRIGEQHSGNRKKKPKTESNQVHIYALRDIEDGEELLTNYGDDYKLNENSSHETIPPIIPPNSTSFWVPEEEKIPGSSVYTPKEFLCHKM